MLKRALLALAASFTFLLPAHATSVLPLYLDEIVDTAAVAFQGTVIGNRSARDEQMGMVVTYTTFQVQDVLKGEPGATYTIKQMGGDLPAEGLRYKAFGIPKFTLGSTYVVFLYGVSTAGFSSPVGLDQGRFHVSDDGKAEVSNGRDFRDLTKRMSPSVASAKAKLDSDAPVRQLGLDEFKQLVRDRAASRDAPRLEGSER